MTNQNDYGIGILGMGKFLPEKILDNALAEKEAGLPSGDILKKTGIQERRIAVDTDTASAFSAQAGAEALKNSGIKPEEIGLVLACTFTGDYIYPAHACKIHKDLKTVNAAAFDLMANCTAFQVGLSVASDKMLLDSKHKYSLVVGTALQSRFIDWKNPDTAMYFGDGSAAAVLGQVPKGYGIQSTDLFTDSRAYESVRLRRGAGHYYELNGIEVWRQVMQYQPKVIRGALEKINKTVNDVDFFIFHQANLKLIEYLMGKMKVPMSKTFTNLERYGNTAEASMGIALCEAIEAGKIKRGDLVVMAGVGAGFTFGASTFIWY